MAVIDPTTAPTNFSFARWPQDDEELWWWVRAVWGKTIPRTRVCPHHSTPFEAFADAYFARSPVAIWYASRGFGGKTDLLSTLGLTEAVALQAQITILGGSGAQSLNVHASGQQCWASPTSPRGLLASDPNKFDTKFTTGAWIRSLMASQTSVRGPHPQRLRLDEIDEMDMEILEAAQGQPMKDNKLRPHVEPHTVMSSTWQWPDKTMATIMARAKERGWPIFTWCVAEGSLVLTARGEVPIQEVTDSDLVLTRQGWRHVQHVTFMGHKPTITLDLGDRQLRCTADHLVATPSGWRHAGALAADTVATVGSDPRVLGCELVSTPAVGGTGLVPPRPGLVLASGDDVEMFDVDARSVSAQVIGLVAGGDRTDDAIPYPVGGVGGGPAGVIGLADSLDSVPVAFGSRPVDVIGGEHGNMVAVYDIGVEGDVHEFIAEGVVVHNCYKETSNPVDGWLTDADVARKREEIPLQMWDTEYELQEPTVGNRAFDSASVEAAFDKALGEVQDDIWNKPGYKESRQVHVTGVDWAKERDLTVALSFNAENLPWECVASYVDNRLPWPVIVGKVSRQWEKHPGTFAHDATGIGNVVSDFIDPDVVRANRRRFVDYVIGGGRARQDLFSEYISAIENGDIRFPRIERIYREHLYCSMDDLFTPKGHPPDSVVAGAVAWQARSKHQRPRIGAPRDVVRANSPHDPAKARH